MRNNLDGFITNKNAMTLRILVIHNPVAGRQRRKKLRELLQYLQDGGHQVMVRPTARRGDAREEARLAKDIDVIVAAGGDGTVNEIVDGLAAKAPDGDLPAVAFLPLGTANVLAWELNLPRSPRALVEVIERKRTLDVMPAIANGRRFFLMASVGLDARAVAAVKDATKRLLGGAAYALAALRALRKPPPRFTVHVDDHATEARSVIVTRARRYGGPFTLAPDAGLETTALHVVLMKSYGLLAALRYGLALAMGRLHRLSDVSVTTGNRIRIEGSDGDPVQMDGDVVSTVPLSITMAERSVPFLVP